MWMVKKSSPGIRRLRTKSSPAHTENTLGSDKRHANDINGRLADVIECEGRTFAAIVEPVVERVGDGGI